MIGLQYDRLSLQPHIHILSGDGFQIVRQIELDAYPLQTVSMLNSQESNGAIIGNLLSNHLYWNIGVMHYGLPADDVELK